MIDFDAMRRLFRARVNTWRLDDFKAFNNVLNTDSCMNIPERRQVIDSWSNNLEDSVLYNIMKDNRPLFEVNTNGKVKTICRKPMQQEIRAYKSKTICMPYLHNI
jgi:hypothetical protein